MYRNVRYDDLFHLIFYQPRLVKNIVGIINPKSYVMIDDDIKGFMLLRKRNMNLKNHLCSDGVLDFLNIYNRTEFKVYEIVALFQKEDNDIIYNIFDRVLNCLDNGDYLWGVCQQYI